MEQLIKDVQEWSWERELDKADSFKQLAKLMEESGEIAASLARNDREELIDAIGDTMVVLIILAQQQGLEVQDCLQEAYDVISKRTGKTVDGIFIKSEDLQEVQ